MVTPSNRVFSIVMNTRHGAGDGNRTHVTGLEGAHCNARLLPL